MLLLKQYRATGRGFVVRHIKFAENYRLYSRSHFVKAWVLHPIKLICLFVSVPRTVIWYPLIHRLEVALLLIVYLAYGYTSGSTTSFILLTLSSWFLVISWLFAPYIFNPSGFEWQKYVCYFLLLLFFMGTSFMLLLSTAYILHKHHFYYTL